MSWLLNLRSCALRYLNKKVNRSIPRREERGLRLLRPLESQRRVWLEHTGCLLRPTAWPTWRLVGPAGGWSFGTHGWLIIARRCQYPPRGGNSTKCFILENCFYHFSFLLCVCMCVCVHMCLFVRMHHVWCWVSSPIALHLSFWDGLTRNWELINSARLETNKPQRVCSLFPPHCWNGSCVPITCEWWDPNSGPSSYTAKHFVDWNVTSAQEGPSLEKGMEKWQVTEAKAAGGSSLGLLLSPDAGAAQGDLLPHLPIHLRTGLTYHQSFFFCFKSNDSCFPTKD